MINTIIFSKNRGIQLDCLLRSLDEYTDGLFRKIVLYTFTDKIYEQGYKYIKQFHPNVKFCLEENLKEDVLNHMLTHYVMFCVDDQIMYKVCPNIPDLEKNEVFSLRLGDNVGHPHTSYPLSVDGHIFRTEDIKPLIERTDFDNPNRLESRLQKFKDKFKLKWQYQAMISIPHNRVSDRSNCKFSGLYTEEILNRYLLDGFVIDYDKMDFSGINNVHKEIDYKFKTR
jgi:hypothetical protein